MRRQNLRRRGRDKRVFSKTARRTSTINTLKMHPMRGGFRL